MKRINVITIAVFVLVAVFAMVAVSLTALAEPADGVADEVDTKIVHISDIHIMIEEYCNIYSADYDKAGNTSYKTLEQTAAAVDTVFAELYTREDGTLKAAADIPLYVVITGDLTSNGELANHLGVAAQLGRVTQEIRALATRAGYEALAGFQIFVIPGNHDIDNQNAKCYTPALDDEQWNALLLEGNAAKMRAYLAAYGARSVQTTTMLQFMSIYSDFGYCNCAGRHEGHHDAGCNIAEGVKLDYFYESDYWYEAGVTRSNAPVALGEDAVALTPTYTYDKEYSVSPAGALTETTPTAQEIAGFKVDKDMEYYARASRHGACSYVARVGGITILGIDANSHKWTDVKEGAKTGVVTSLGWDETTGGYMTKAQINWLTEEVKNDVRDNRLILALAHENVLPHFDTEDEVISLFTYDNWEDVYTNLANNGIRYVFTGHQHTNDIESDVTQMGSVFYDFETGSTTCMGAGWRELDFKQTTYTDGAYAEDVWSTMHFLHYNDTVTDANGTHKVFAYNRYEVADDGTYASRKVYQLDADGNYMDLADYMSLALKGMISNMAGNFVNEQLMDTLVGMTAGLQDSKMSYLYPLVGKILADLDKLDLKQFVKDADGGFHLSDAPVKGYNLTQFALDFVDYFLHKDYSFDKKLGVYLDDVLLYVYGNHLIGGQCLTEDEIPAGIQALLDVLEDGTFLRFVEDLLYRGLMPELEVILNAPIYWGDSIDYRNKETHSITAATVADGKGFDISAEAPALLAQNNVIVNVIKVLVTPSDGLPGIDVSSLMNIVKSIPDTWDPAVAALKDIGIDVNDLLGGLLGSSVADYVDKAMGYIKKLNEKSLMEVLKEELLDKYVTDAFCTNLGSYGAYVVRSVIVDDSLDGVQRTNDGGLFPYRVIDNFHVELTYAGDKSAMKGHTYYRDKDGNDTVKVVATKENGLLPGKITIGNVVDAEGNLDLTKKEIRWFTQRDVDYGNVCKQYEWTSAKAAAAEQFYCEMQVSTDKQFAGAAAVLHKGENVWIEYPTVDLGITFLNLTYAYRQYNDFDVTLTGLEAGKTYYYRLRAVDVGAAGTVTKTYEWTDTYSFTMPAASGGFDVLAMTDIQGSIEKNYQLSLNSMFEALKGGNPAFIVDCGDNVDKGENIAQWSWLLDDQAVVWANNTLAGVAGNHEDHNYSMSYVTATPDVAVVDETGFYYSYNYQNVHFVFLNTNDIQTYEITEDGVDEDGFDIEVKYTYKGLGEAQYNWLVADLDAANANTNVQFIIVVLHKGPYTAGSHAFDADVDGLRNQLAPLFAQKKVDVVLQGHDHTYSVSQYIGGTADKDGKYTPTAVRYDATGAAIDPEGVLYVNLGTMGDKFYNYIYSSKVSLRDRAADSYLNVELGDYITKDGNLELTETPVYMYLNVTNGRLTMTSYTVVDGKSVLVDDFAITKAPVAVAQEVKVLGVAVKADKLAELETVRVPLTVGGKTEVYVCYRLADVLAAGGKVVAVMKVDGNQYEVKDCYVAVAKTAAGSASVEAIDPTVIAVGESGPTFIDAAKTNGLPIWAIVLIAVGAALVVAAAVVAVLFVLKRKKVSVVEAQETVEDAADPADETKDE